MKRVVYLLFFAIPYVIDAQTFIQGQVKDKNNKEAIPYCAIGLKHKSAGCLSNEEGYFQLSLNTETDTLIIHTLGYKQVVIPASSIARNPIVYLSIQASNLEEVTVYSTNDYLYAMLDECRQSLMNFKSYESKVYYVLESDISDQAVELLECYYNAKFNNVKVKELDFKNGRVGIAPINGRYFVNLNISKVFTCIDLINENEHLPAIPFQFNKRKLKKTYSLNLKQISGTDNPVYVIEFVPLTNNGRYFKGEVWIEKKTGRLKKIDLNIQNTSYHPFLPAYEGLSEIKDVSMQISKTYAEADDQNVLSHIDFNYQLNYKHLHQSSFLNSNPDTMFKVNSKGVMYFYDYKKPFVLPYFFYDSELSDYRKIASLSYNESFWTVNNGLIYTQKMKKNINYFKVHGQLINYTNALNNKQNLAEKGKWGFENNYLPWTAKQRLSLKKNAIKNDTLSTAGTPFTTTQYNLKAQIFLDLNPVGDSIQHFSAAIFDVYETYYNLPEEYYTNCFINIYFDLVEIERRHMEKLISKTKLNLTQFDSLYKETNKRISIQTNEYLKDVERGKNIRALQKWNDLVKRELMLDNMAIFNVLLKTE